MIGYIVHRRKTILILFVRLPELAYDHRTNWATIYVQLAGRDR